MRCFGLHVTTDGSAKRSWANLFICMDVIIMKHNAKAVAFSCGASCCKRAYWSTHLLWKVKLKALDDFEVYSPDIFVGGSR